MLYLICCFYQSKRHVVGLKVRPIHCSFVPAAFNRTILQLSIIKPKAGCMQILKIHFNIYTHTHTLVSGAHLILRLKNAGCSSSVTVYQT